MMENMLKSFNPADGQLIGQVAETPVPAIRDMVSESRRAQKEWAALSFSERIGYIAAGAEKIGRRAEEMGLLLSREMGKSLSRSLSEVRGCLYAGKTAEMVSESLRPRRTAGYGIETVVENVPLGVCAVISPWNYPVSMAHWMIVPALTAGNTVILKPSEETPLVAGMYVNALNEALPPGVLQIVFGGDEQGRALAGMQGVDFIGFTGSKETGKKIMEGAAGTLKRLILELGGKDPLLVLKDADLDKAARFAVANSLENAGQMCVSTERIFVDQEIAEPFIKRLIPIISNYKTGPFTDPEADIGPIINEKQRRRILRQIDDAAEKGAKVIYSGGEHPPRFISPMILDGVTDDMLIAREETFGPVLCVSRYEKLEEAIASANATDYGLGAAVFGKKDARAAADKLEAGMIGINTGPGGVGDAPWVGAKQSGYGYHGSPDGHRQFTQTRVVTKMTE